MPRKRMLDDLMEAVTFAEAGETETARQMASEIFPEEAAGQAGRILAVSGASGFSPGMIEDSVGMAERLDYGLIALSVPPALARLAAKLGAGALQRGTRLSAEVFRAKAAERGVPFVHAVRSGDPEVAVTEISRQFRRIAFLLIERELAPRARFAAVSIPIFYLGT
jgi:hypothetical protein